MRKWMRERLQRRKKGPEGTEPDPAPAPLQPAYFDAGGPPAASASEPPAAHPEKPVESAEQTLPAREPQAQSQPVRGSGDSRRRRRRGRGGRNRGRSRGQAMGTAAGTAQRVPFSAEAAAASGASNAVDSAQAPGQAPGQAPQSTAPRASKGIVVLAIGLPGSGKSSWFKRHNITPLSSDMLRALLFDDPTEQRFQDLVFSNLRSMLKARLIARRPMNYVDATNLTPHERQSWIKLAQGYGYEAQAVFFDVAVEICLQRNQRRERVVQEDVMRRMAAKLRPPTFDEGFTKITVVKVKQKD